MDPDRFLHKLIEYPGPASKLAGLDVALQSIEELITHARAQHIIRLKARLRQYGNTLHPEDADDEIYDIEVLNDQILPKVMLGGFIVMLWSVFESCVKDLAEYTRKEKQCAFSLEDLRAGDFLKQMEKYFDRTLGVIAFPNKNIRKRIDDLKRFRNCLVHSDGNIKDLPPSLKAKNATEYKKRNLILYRDLHHQYVVPNIDFTKDNLDLINRFLVDVSERLYTELHPITEQGAPGDAPQAARP
jgi:hypothetical protein